MRMRRRSTVQIAFRRILGGIALAAAFFGIYRSACAAWADALALDGNVVEAVRLTTGNASQWVALANRKELLDTGAEDALDRARRLNPYDGDIWIQSGLRA